VKDGNNIPKLGEMTYARDGSMRRTLGPDEIDDQAIPGPAGIEAASNDTADRRHPSTATIWPGQGP